jgi:hypothetical protein
MVWDDFFSDLLPDVNGCPSPSAELALLRSAQEFFERTGVWVAVFNVNVTANVVEYPLPFPTDAELVKIERATYLGRDISVTAESQLPSDWRLNSQSLANCIHTSNKKTVNLLPVPVVAGSLNLDVILRPARSATGINDVFSCYAEAIAHGAKVRLMSQKDKPYTNLSMVPYYEEKFNSSINAVCINKMRGFSSRRVRSPGKFF